MDNDERLNIWLEQYANRLYRLAYTLTRSSAEAEDRVQEALIKAYYAMDRFDPSRPAFPWLARIVINECRMGRRRTFRETLTRLLPEKSCVSAEESVLKIAEQNEVYRAVLRLPAAMRAPIVLYYFEELSVAEIAEALEVRPGTIKSRLSRARSRLGLLLKEEPEHDRRTDTQREKLV